MLDELRLVFRHDPGVVFVEVELCRDGRRCLFVVARHHADAPESQVVQPSHDFGRFLAQRIGDADGAHKDAVYSKIELRVFGGDGIEFFLLAFRYPAFFIFENEVIAADDRALVIDLACDAVCYDIFDA